MIIIVETSRDRKIQQAQNIVALFEQILHLLQVQDKIPFALLFDSFKYNPIMTQERKAVSLDLDGVVFTRPTQVQWGGLKELAHFWSYNKSLTSENFHILLARVDKNQYN